jgi:hypothetical protein
MDRDLYCERKKATEDSHPPTGLMATRRKLLKAAAAVGSVAVMPLTAFATTKSETKLRSIVATTMETHR